MVAVASKPVVITRGFLSMVLYRQANNLETTVEIDKKNFTLPTYKEVINEKRVKESDISCKVVLFKGNPYTWHSSAARGDMLVIWWYNVVFL